MSCPVETNNELFDVSTIFPQSCYRGLFVDRKLHLWTRNQNGRYRRLANQWSLPPEEYPYSIDELRESIAKSRAFAEFLKKAHTALNECQAEAVSLKGKFVIAIVNDGLPEFPRSPQVFDTREEADTKLMRYQQLNPGTRFCLFECKGELKSIGVVLE